jgi:hypothetical protein
MKVSEVLTRAKVNHWFKADTIAIWSDMNRTILDCI